MVLTPRPIEVDHRVERAPAPDPGVDLLPGHLTVPVLVAASG
jgi:hypothetical protein